MRCFLNFLADDCKIVLRGTVSVLDRPGALAGHAPELAVHGRAQLLLQTILNIPCVTWGPSAHSMDSTRHFSTRPSLPALPQQLQQEQKQLNDVDIDVDRLAELEKRGPKGNSVTSTGQKAHFAKLQPCSSHQERTCAQLCSYEQRRAYSAS